MNQKRISQKCKYLITKWQESLNLSNYEIEKFQPILKKINFQLSKLETKKFQISVFGRVGVGKSSLLNALIKKQLFSTGLDNGHTKQIKIHEWGKSFNNLNKVQLIDTPGIDEINEQRTEELTFEHSLDTDLILFVLDSDITRIELKALEKLLNNNKPILLILNRCDQWNKEEAKELLSNIQRKLSFYKKSIDISLAASSPRRAEMKADGTVRSEIISPKVITLQENLKSIIENKGELLLCINVLRTADNFYKLLKEDRLRRKKEHAQSLIGKFAAIKASGVAINPLLIFDLATGIACDSALVLQLSNLYGLKIGGPAARELLKKLSLQNSLLGGAQLGIQITLSLLQKILFFASPLTGGLSLTPSLPIAVAQVALAVHTTKTTGRLAAENFLNTTNRKNGQPSLMLKYLIKKNTDLRMMIDDFNCHTPFQNNEKNVLLP